MNNLCPLCATGEKVRLLCRDANEAGAVLVLAFPSQLHPSKVQLRLEDRDEWRHITPQVFISQPCFNLDLLLQVHLKRLFFKL